MLPPRQLNRCLYRGMVVVAGVFMHGIVLRAEVPIEQSRHLGVATCASSVCHGKLSPQSDRNVWLNEYRIWTRARRHSETYRLLENEQSRTIARNLGLTSATTAKVCLDCHADNVPADRRGPKFQITDGVSCEACHGGAENWIESHAEAEATHEDNLARGMYPTESPQARAALCLTCHLGTDEKFATHDIMGAGHPRLSFELEAFTANQPAHYEVDDDYRQRKGEIPGFNLWVTGQLQNAVSYLELIRSDLFPGNGQFPELAFYDCHACHHAMDEKRWTPERGGPGVPPGSPRLQDQHLLLLEVVAEVVESAAAAGEIRSAAETFVAAGHSDLARARSVAATLIEVLTRHQATWATAKYNLDTVRGVRRALIRAAAQGRMSDFNAAEQTYLALESLSYSIGDRQALEDTLDSLYLEVETNSAFDPGSFATAARRGQERF